VTPETRDEKPDVLKIDGGIPGYKYYYNREERLLLKNSRSQEIQKRRRLKKISSWLLVVLAISIGMLVFFLLYKLMN